MHWLPENALKFSKIIEFCFVFDQISLKILPTTDSRNSNNRRIMQTTNSKMREFCPRSETCKNFTAQLPVAAKLHSFKVSKQNVTFLVTCVMILTKFDVWVVRSRTPPPGWDFDQFLFFCIHAPSRNSLVLRPQTELGGLSVHRLLVCDHTGS